MIMQTFAAVERSQGLKKLVRRREQLREKLKDHFCRPASQRNYEDFELVIDELDEVRRKIFELKRSEGR